MSDPRCEVCGVPVEGIADLCAKHALTPEKLIAAGEAAERVLWGAAPRQDPQAAAPGAAIMRMQGRLLALVGDISTLDPSKRRVACMDIRELAAMALRGGAPSQEAPPSEALRRAVAASRDTAAWRYAWTEAAWPPDGIPDPVRLQRFILVLADRLGAK